MTAGRPRLKPGAHQRLLWAFAIIIIAACREGAAESLTPPYFNLAEGRNITATATCGVDSDGRPNRELFCKLIGSSSDTELSEKEDKIIKGQYCDYCDPNQPGKFHSPEHAVDGKERWWQSPPLSRGMKYQEVNLTIDLGQEFHVAYIFISMGNSPRPALWVLEKSADYGKSWTPWQYFADTPSDCMNYFGKDPKETITQDDSVLCTTEFSKIVPLENGEIPVSILNGRPSANYYFNSTVLQEWTRATNIRFRFLRTKNLLGHLMSVARQDPTVTRRYFYSIKEINVGGRCMCNGHAQSCEFLDPKDSKILMCNCKHNTCGSKCNTCCPGFEQKKWKQSTFDHPFSCEPCNCHLHSNECEYDPEIDRQNLSLDIHGKYEGGGVCKNCRHNTDGVNCNKCIPKYYRPYHKHWNETDVCYPCQCDNFYSTGNCEEGSGRCECRKEFTPPLCDKCSFGYYDYPLCKPCECNMNGTTGLQCSTRDGSCSCKPNFAGEYCKQCAPGFYSYPECKPCECDLNGSDSESCEHESGNCTCKASFAGKKCDQCQSGYYDYPSCNYCNCDIKGTKEGICNNQTGQCICKEGYGGELCGVCMPGYYGYPDCRPCNCSKIGSLGPTCSSTGKCSCLTNYAGKTCDQCSPGYYSYPECKPCECDIHGSDGVTCDNEGTCQCLNNFDGQRCDICKEGYYNFPACEDCNCHPAGVVAGFAGCGSVPAGELCQCKERVEGRICNKCKPLYWNLNPTNPEGCEECNCNPAGVLGGIAVCDSEFGQCVCKPSVVARSCSECADGTFNLQEENMFGCTDCGCDVGGAVNHICNKHSGQCQCQSRVTGRTCREPLQAHYFPTLYQYQYEVEDGRTPENTRVRYRNDDNEFKNYSWKGYAFFSNIQKEVIRDIHIFKPSLYQIVFRYVNPNPSPVIGVIKITPDNPNDIEQSVKVQFQNTSEPAFTTVSGEIGNIPKPFVMNPGRWSVSISTNESVNLDYFVLLPEDFYLPTILNERIERPCTINETDMCRHYALPNITSFDKTFGAGAYVPNGKFGDPLTEFFEDQEHLHELNIYNRVPLLNPDQPDTSFNLTVFKPGPYVILINYVTPLSDLRTHRIDVIAHDKHGPQIGDAILYSCPYTMACRQVVVNDRDGVAIFNVEENNLVVDLKSDNGNVGIHSVYAIPYDQWSLDYIKPKPVCIRKDGECIPGTFRNPPETKKISFDQDIEGELAKNRPPIRVVNEKRFVWLNGQENSVDLKGKVPSPGYYTFVLHYYQPDYPDFNIDVIIQNGQFYEAKVPVQHCPSESGCRSVVLQADGNNRFNLMENFMITFNKKPDGKNVYLDYILVIPTDLYQDKNLEEEDLDRTEEFISTCGSNHFNIDTSHKGFCRDSVFSITAAHNTGALPCMCDFKGSQSFECEKFGGQCPCKDNIIGRQCTACKTGYYGFPECRQCNCPLIAYCEPNTGQCVCPPHVLGEKCDQCEPFTYAYDQYNGCELCNCNYQGVLNGQRQCDVLSGSCPCKDNVVGRACDSCQAGFYAFPYCQSCDCDTRGTTFDICDQDTAECLCKKNVVGPQCNFCQEGSYNLQETNPDGCTSCFCFGKTTRCHSADYTTIHISDMNKWEIVQVNRTEDGEALNVTKLNVSIPYTDNDPPTIGADFFEFNQAENIEGVYFAAPIAYRGKKLAAYGGYLRYGIYYNIAVNGTAVNGADVILEGAGGDYLIYRSMEQPSHAVKHFFDVELVEQSFETPSGDAAKREHIMEVLKDLQGVYIRATYWTKSVTTRLIEVSQDIGIPTKDHREVYPELELVPFGSVEQCQCPPNYQGLSCEECAPGYYRIDNGPFGGYCVPCQCNGHSRECDVNTGVCLNCLHNTRGEHCEMCEVGYHGNAMDGTPNDCLICACPLPIASNNFATSCDLSEDGERISCECTEGYFGPRCQVCAPGFYGRPEKLGDFCKPCQCSGNINPDDPRSCDTTTGQCLNCLNNTFGEACALCAPGYFGDAINLKDCQACICDEIGTDSCDHTTGRCHCKPNVVGEKCDACDLEHYGFESGNGCTRCECADASESNQCDDATGQCKCKPGVTGRACDRCTAGYWNYTSEGCVSCGCKSEYSLGFGCNANTGQCECLPGVLGEKCDQCPHRWAFVPEQGCHECDSCHHALLNDTDALADIIDPIIVEFDSAQSGFFTRRRLDNMREQLDTSKSKFKEIDPQQVSLVGPLKELEDLEQLSKNLNRKSNYSLENSEDLRNQSARLKDLAEVLTDDLANAEESADAVLQNIIRITRDISDKQGAEVENAYKEGQDLLEAMKVYNLTGRESDAIKQLEKVNELLKNVSTYETPVENLQKEVDGIKAEIKKFNAKLDDLYNHTQYSLNMANDAEKIIARNGLERLKGKLNDIETQIGQSKVNLEESEALLANASDLVNDAIGKLKELRDLPEELETRNKEFKSRLDNNKEDIEQINKLKPKVQTHAHNLAEKVELLRQILDGSQIGSNDAIKAARAYKDIVEAVKSAREAVESAQNDTDHAVSILDKVQNGTESSDQKSSDVLDEAQRLNQQSRDDLRPILKKAIENFSPVKGTHDNNSKVLKDIEQILDNIQLANLDKAYRNASKMADEASNYIKEVEKTVNNSFVTLPQEAAKAKALPKDLDGIKRNLTQIDKDVKSVREKIPAVEEALDTLPAIQEERSKISDKIRLDLNKLKQQIDLARDKANRIEVGAKFYPNTTLELRNPSNIEDLTTFTNISGYFKTDKPNGLVFYLGNPNGTKLRWTKSDDYMALVIENGYPVLKLDIGNGPESIINGKTVSDNQWYQFIIERVGHNAKLSIREEGLDRQEKITTAEKPLAGPYTIFNLDKEKSKLFVGSSPVQYQLQEGMNDLSFDGEIEDLVIGNNPVSMWNFVNGYENNHGAKERDKLVDLQPSNGFRFNGQGYLIIDAKSLPLRYQSDISFSFKTFAMEGLMFLAGKENTFMSIELRNGKVLYQYNLGNGNKKFVSNGLYNDGQWHKVTAIRQGAAGKLTVDDENVIDRTKQISGENLEPIDTILFGGYVHNHEFQDVAKIGFDGCIKDVIIASQEVDLTKNIQDHNVTPGCPAKVSFMVSFNKSRDGYVGWQSMAVNNDFRVSLKFKTQEKNGLIFFLSDEDQENTLSISLVEGKIKVISQKIDLESNDRYDDGEWHVVSVIHNDEHLRADFDDYSYKGTDSSPPKLHALRAYMFVGGLPRRISPHPNTVGTNLPFHGCIGDLTVNGKVQNFANTTERAMEIMDKCILDAGYVPLDQSVHTLPTVTSLPDSQWGVTNAPGSNTEATLTDRPKDIRGDGGGDYGRNPDSIQPVHKRPLPPPITEGPANAYKSTKKPGAGMVPTTTPKPVFEGCALPVQPVQEDLKSTGYRFGTKPNSRVEFPTVRGKFRRAFDISMDFKTSEQSPDGLLFYIGDAKKHQQWVALYMQSGYVIFTFKGDGDPLIIKSQAPYNDDQWHTVELSRKGENGKLVIDGGSLQGKGSNAVTLNLDVPIYLGGVHEDYVTLVQSNLNYTSPFSGCIKNFFMNDKPMEKITETGYGVIPCSDNVEHGTYFGGGQSTYIKLKERHKVGETFNIKMDIKPRVNSGVLIAVHGKKDYFVLEMVHGALKLTVENGKGPMTATYLPPDNNTFSLCDGQWHEIQAIKSKNVVSLSVDSVYSDPKIGSAIETSTDTGSALFLGGHRYLKRVRGITSRAPFVGCIKNVALNTEPVELTAAMAEGNITVGTCWTN